jgi:DNA-binding GntR family transcriptional regulator
MEKESVECWVSHPFNPTYKFTEMSTKNDNFAGALKPLAQRKSAGQHIFEHLKQAIILGDISAGNRMVESRIAETMGVSRTPVREAIHKLEREGLLTRQNRGGFIVAGLNREEIEECFGIRAVLEGYAARLATVKHEPKELNPLVRKIDLFEKHLLADELEVLPKINTELHDLLYALSRSPKLVKMINDLQGQIFRFRKIILSDKTLAHASHQDHRDMLAMMKKRQGEEVELLVREHILKGQAAVLLKYDRDELE